MAMFGFRREQQKTMRLEKFLKEAIDEAGRDFKVDRPRWLTFVGSKRRDRLALPPILVKGFNYALRSAFVAGAPPVDVVYQTAANVVIDSMMDYYQKTPSKINQAGSSGDYALSFNLVASQDVSERFKDEVARMRVRLQAAILATAEYIEMEQFVSLDEVLQSDVEPPKKRQIKEFVDAQYKLHVSYRSLAISLQLFTVINQEMLRKIKSNQKTNPDQANRFFTMNAVFVFEIADLIMSFLQAFELQGIKELRQIHDNVLEEVERGRTQNQDILDRVTARGESGRLSMLKLDRETDSAKERQGALDTLANEWSILMKKVDDAESGSYSFRECIEDLDIIKRSAAANLTVLNLMAITKMVQSNIDAVEGMLQVDRLQLPPITADDVLRYLNVGRAPSQQGRSAGKTGQKGVTL